MRLNTLLASPAFAAWTEGTPLDMEALLGSRDRPRASIVSVAHLDDRQRVFVVALMLSELVAWMRRQPASGGLRVLVAIDEVQGLLPPHPAKPPTKPPLLTLLKLGRGFGVGVWLATQNPVDLDYKALGNAGIRVIGRLITQRDRSRALEGLGMATLDDGRDADDLVAGLGKREFVLDNVHTRPRVTIFGTRWAMSYLRGPVTLAEMAPLLEAFSEPGAEAGQAASEVADTPGGAVPPVLTDAIRQRFRATGPGIARPELLVRSRVTIDQKAFDLHRVEEEVWVFPIVAGGVDWEGHERLGELPALGEEIPKGVRFPVAAPPGIDQDLESAERDFVRWRGRHPLRILVNHELGLSAEREEPREAFLARCLTEADRADDATQERVRRRYQERMRALGRRLERERDELDRDREQHRARRAEEVLGIVESLVSVLLGSRSVRSASSKAASRARSVATRRRMSQRASGSIEESEREIERIERELESLAQDLQEEIDRIAQQSEDRAAAIEELSLRPKSGDVVVREILLVWT
jgi:hypothetical protein